MIDSKTLTGNIVVPGPTYSTDELVYPTHITLRNNDIYTSYIYDYSSTTNFTRPGTLAKIYNTSIVPTEIDTFVLHLDLFS